MAFNMKLDDKMADYILAKIDSEPIIKSMFPDWNRYNTNVKCHVHDETKASLHIDLDGKAHCFGCKWSAINIIDLYAKFHGKTYQEARDELYDMVVDAIPNAKVESFVRALQKNKAAMSYLTQTRRLEPWVISTYMLGYDPNTKRITIPNIDQYGACINIRYLDFERRKETKFKMLNEKGHGEARLYPEWIMGKENKVLLVEGEIDSLTGIQLGVPTVSWTSGATSWNQKYDWMWRGKAVVVRYDADSAGKEGMGIVVKNLERLKVSFEVWDPPGLTGKLPKKDLNDWFVHYGNGGTFKMWWSGLSGQLAKLELPKQRGVCPTCGRAL